MNTFPDVEVGRIGAPKKFVASNEERITDLGEKTIPLQTARRRIQHSFFLDTICACHHCARAMQFSPYRGQETSGSRSALRPALLYSKKCQIFPPILAFSNSACHPCTGVMQNMFAQKKKNNVQLTPCRRENRHSCEGSPMICGRLFRDIRTFGRAVEGSIVSPLRNTRSGLSGCRRGATHQESVPLLHSSFLDFVPELWPWIWAVAPAVLPSSSGKHTASKAPIPHDAKAQPRVDCTVPLGAPNALTSLVSVLGASVLLARGASRGGAELPHPSAAAVLLPALPLEGE